MRDEEEYIALNSIKYKKFLLNAMWFS